MKIDIPKIAPDFEQLAFQEIFKQEDPSLDRCQIIDDEFEHESMERINLDQVIFKNCKFMKTTFNHFDALDVRFENCDLSNVNLYIPADLILLR